MFTSRHYRAIAKVMLESKPESEHLGTDTHIRWNVICENLAYEFANDNTRFKRDRFMDACGYNA